MPRPPTDNETLRRRGAYRADRHAGRASLNGMERGGVGEWTHHHIIALTIRDYFCTFGSGPQAIEEMRRAWQDESVRRAVYRLNAERKRPGPPWAETKFGAIP